MQCLAQPLNFNKTFKNEFFQVLKNFLTYVDQLEELVSKDKMEISEKEFKQALDKITGDKVENLLIKGNIRD